MWDVVKVPHRPIEYTQIRAQISGAEFIAVALGRASEGSEQGGPLGKGGIWPVAKLPVAVLDDQRVKGIAPSPEVSQVPQGKQVPDSATDEYTQIRAQIAGALGRDLAQVVTGWGELSPPLRAAILAIVRSSRASAVEQQQ